MKKIIILLVIFFSLSSSVFAAKNIFKIKDSDTEEITFEQITVGSGSIEEQFVEVKDTKIGKKYSGVIAYIIDSIPPNDYKRQLPYTSWVNPSFIIRYEIAYSPSNSNIVIFRILDNRSEKQEWEVDEKTITLEWYLIKKK